MINTVSPYVENGKARRAKYNAENVVPIVSKAYISTEIPAADFLRTTRMACGSLYRRLPMRTHTPTIVLKIVSKGVDLRGVAMEFVPTLVALAAVSGLRDDDM